MGGWQPVDRIHAELSRLTGPLALPEKLAVLRRRLGMKQHDVAVATNVPAAVISKIEHGTLNMEEHLKALCQFYTERFGTLDPGELSVAELLYILRRRRSLTQAEVEEKTGVPKTVLCMVERENRPGSCKHLRTLLTFYSQRECQ